jgi:hypothetical protein
MKSSNGNYELENLETQSCPFSAAGHPLPCTKRNRLLCLLMAALTVIVEYATSGLFLDDRFVQRDQCTDASSDQDTLPTSVHSGVDTSDILEINKPSERDILAKDHENQQRLDDVESQWIKGIVEVGSVASAPWLAS